MDQWVVNRSGRRVVNPTEGWFNLDTGRTIKNPTGWAIRGLRFIGSIPALQNFWTTNILHLGMFLPTGSTFEQSIYQPSEDVSILAEEKMICFRGTAGTVLPATRTTDVSNLSSDQINSLCRFTFGGLFSKVRIRHVVDGDTLDVVVYVPLIELGTVRNQKASILFSEVQPFGFFGVIRIRMYGYDAIEHDKPEGQMATRLLTEKLASLQNTVWCQFLEEDKYGRSLALLYENENRTGLLNEFLIQKSRELNIRLAYPYTGGTKRQ